MEDDAGFYRVWVDRDGSCPSMHMSVLHNRELWYMTFKYLKFEINICVGENGLQLFERLENNFIHHSKFSSLHL